MEDAVLTGRDISQLNDNDRLSFFDLLLKMKQDEPFVVFEAGFLEELRKAEGS